VSATLSPVRVTEFPSIDLEELQSGLRNALGPNAALDAAADEWDYNTPSGDHPGLMAWVAVESEIAAEIAPDFTRLLREAIEKRLPWTWEPDR
jgi:hypothetical protein